MKAHWKYQEYETTTGRALRFWFMKQWFPIRRACRFAKRALRRVKRWLPWYAAAACIVAVAYFGLAQFGLLSSEQARASFIGWVITGVLAVTVLDVCKVESNRRSSLTAQYDALCSRQYDFEWALQQLASALCADDAHGWSLGPVGSCTRASFSSPPDGTLLDEEAAKQALEQLAYTADELKGALNNVSLVDCRREELGRFHREIQQQIAALRTALEEHARINSAQAMDDLTGAIQALYRYASRPWHLPIDIAREQLLERYVEQTMVEIEWRYADGSGPCG